MCGEPQARAYAWRSILLGIELEEVSSQQWHILPAAAQRGISRQMTLSGRTGPRGSGPSLTACCRFDVGGGKDADVYLDLLGATDVHKTAVLQNAEILACISIDMVPISSRKMVPPLATSKRPFFAALAEVKAPLS